MAFNIVVFSAQLDKSSDKLGSLLILLWAVWRSSSKITHLLMSQNFNEVSGTPQPKLKLLMVVKVCSTLCCEVCVA